MARGYAECTGEPEARLDIQHIRCCAMCAARTSATAGTARHCAKCAAHFAQCAGLSDSPDLTNPQDLERRDFG